MTVAVAQTYTNKADIEGNIVRHLRLIALAAKHRVQYLVFPELSLTGYEPELAESLALTIDDQRLQPLSDAASAHQMVIVAGAPLKTEGKPKLAALIFSPDGSIGHYDKMHLHAGEQRFFSAGEKTRVVAIDVLQIGQAICADTTHPEHAQQYARQHANGYFAGVLITANGYDQDCALLAQYAHDHRMLVGMANHCAPSGGWTPAGRSAIWFAGNVLAEAGAENEALVIASFDNDVWQAQVVTP